MFLGELAHRLGLDVAGHDQHGVVGSVEAAIEGAELVDAKLLHVVGIARCRHRVGLVEAEQQLARGLVEHLGRHVVDPHAPLFQHHLALGLELTVENAQVDHAVGFHAHHQLEAVGCDGLVVAGHVEVGEGIVAAAVARNGARELGRRQRAGPLEHHMLEEMGDAGLAKVSSALPTL